MNYLKAGWPYFALLIVGLIAGLEYKSNQEHEAANKANAALLALTNDSLKQLRVRIAADTVPLAHIHDTVTKVVTRIRTLVLTKIDSGLADAAAAIALVPPSDTACHKALDKLLTPCQQARAQIVADSALFRSIGDTVALLKQHDVEHVAALGQATTTIDSVKRAYSCQIKVLFTFGCPSRTASAAAGGILTAIGFLIFHK